MAKRWLLGMTLLLAAAVIVAALRSGRNTPLSAARREAKPAREENALRPAVAPTSTAASEAQPSGERPVNGDQAPSAVELTSALDAASVASAKQLTWPLIQAIRAEYADEPARRDAMLQALRASGASREDWTAHAASTFNAWQRTLGDEPGLAVDTRYSSCFRAGCEVSVVFADEQVYQRASERFRGLHEDDARHGGRVQTPAVRRADGTYEGSWIILRPSTSPAAQQNG